MVFTRAVVGEGAPSSVLRTAPPRAQSDFRSRSRLVRSRVATRPSRRATRPVGWVKPLRGHPAQGEQTLNMWARSPWCMIYMVDALACPWFRSVVIQLRSWSAFLVLGLSGWSEVALFARVCGWVGPRLVRSISPTCRGERRRRGRTTPTRDCAFTAHAPSPWSLPRQGLHTTGHLRPAAA